MSMLPVGIGSAEAGGYQIERSLRFNFSDSAHLNRTPASATNRTTWTYSYWFKSMMLKPGVNDYWAFSAFNDGSNYTAIRHHNEYYIDVLSFNAGSAVSNVKTQKVFRDPSAWNHMVIVFDTGNATQSDRVRIYHNGIRADIRSGATYPGSGSPTGWVNSTSVHYIGRTSTEYFDGYLTEINFIDGQALTPSSFGETDTDTGVWKPKAYSGSYGPNGIYLKFADNSGTTSTTLGKDSSGNGNNWTPNNFSVTAGAGNDSLVDVPTPYGEDTGVGGEVRGNYNTINVLDKGSGLNVTNGNLQHTADSSGNWYQSRGTIAFPSTGKWYWEVTFNAGTNSWCSAGMAPSTIALTMGFGPGTYGNYYGMTLDGTLYANNASTGSYGSAFSSGDVLMVAFDRDNSKIYFGRNGTWFNSSNPATQTNPAASSISTTATFFTSVGGVNSSGGASNFGQRPFAYTAPSGFKALCTQNLPEPTIKDGGDYFNTVLYTGNGSTQSIPVGFAPDFVWAKNRQTTGYHHDLYDRVRGNNLRIFSSQTSAETTGYLQFTSTGFDLSAGGGINATGESHVAWNWKANGAGSTNTAGNITSTVSVNTTSGFSIVAYTGTGTSGRTVGHGLGVTPGMIFVKSRSASGSWIVWQQSLPGINYNLYLQTTDSQQPDAQFTGAINSTTFGIHVSGGSTNQSGVTYIAYCFAPVAGYSAFGSYTGNGSSTDGPFIYTGFRPRYVLIKSSSNISNWIIFDSARGTYNVNGPYLYANGSDAEGTSTTVGLDFLSNGFKHRNNYGDANTLSRTYIYMALAENPFKYSLAR